MIEERVIIGLAALAAVTFCVGLAVLVLQRL